MARWLIDLDSTTIATVDRQVALANRRFGTAYTVADITGWDWHEYLPAEVCDYVWGDEVFGNLDFHATCPAVPGAVEAVRGLLDAGDVVWFVSDRPQSLFTVTRAWLDEQGLREAALVLTHREIFPKVEAAREYDLEYVVEDAPHNATALANANQTTHVYLIDYPYNQSVAPHPKITRVRGWSEIVAGRLDADAA